MMISENNGISRDIVLSDCIQDVGYSCLDVVQQSIVVTLLQAADVRDFYVSEFTRWYGQFAFSPSAERYFVSFLPHMFAVGEHVG